MIRIALILLITSNTVISLGQSINDSQQRALNNYVSFVNHLTEEVNGLTSTLVRSYEVMEYYKKYPNRPIQPYVCKLNYRDYFYEEAKKTSVNLGDGGSSLVQRAVKLKSAYDDVESNCKAIETYFRLKDYQRDDFGEFQKLISKLQVLVKHYSELVQLFQSESENLYRKLQIYDRSNGYHLADQKMRTQLEFERQLLNTWNYNLNEAVHTGWSYDEAQKHILANNSNLIELNKIITNPSIQYPASSMMKSFVDAIESLQQTKRSGVDGYTYEQKQSDRYSNQVYHDLINYYNNAAVSFYNNYINMAKQNGFKGIYHSKYVVVFEVRSVKKEIDLSVSPFKEHPFTPIKIVPQNVAITNPVFTSLVNYISFINEGVRQIDHMMSPMRNLNSSASHGKARLKLGERVTINYYHKNFELPTTLFQQTVNQSKQLPAGYQKALVDQANTLYSILEELNQWNTVLLADADAKQLQKDSLDHVYAIIERFKMQSETFDQKKERLYGDVRAIFDSYKPINATSPWWISGSQLLQLLEEDKKQLFLSKAFLSGDSTSSVSSEVTQQLARKIITDEFQNLKGIQKLGRSNGNCPYTPYEDLAENSNNYITSILKTKPGSRDNYYKHPYNRFVHWYNETLLRDYNKFTELSKVALLPMIKQVQLFEVIEPEIPTPKKETITQRPIEIKREEVLSKPEPTVKGSVIHDTVRITDIIRIETVRQDTVYISKVDTVYVGLPGEASMTMEGYATNNMVLLLDVSGSMNNPDKLPLLKKSVLLLLKMMRPEDEVSIVTYSGKAKVALSPTSFTEEAKIKRVIERLKSEGRTDGIAGLKLAYEVADKNYIRGGNNRIILATDGEFPIDDETYKMVKHFSGEDIFISVFNFGRNTVSAQNLQKLAETGKGNYEFITQANVDSKLIQEAKAKRKR